MATPELTRSERVTARKALKKLRMEIDKIFRAAPKALSYQEATKDQPSFSESKTAVKDAIHRLEELIDQTDLALISKAIDWASEHRILGRGIRHEVITIRSLANVLTNAEFFHPFTGEQLLVSGPFQSLRSATNQNTRRIAETQAALRNPEVTIGSRSPDDVVTWFYGAPLAIGNSLLLGDLQLPTDADIAADCLARLGNAAQNELRQLAELERNAGQQLKISTVGSNAEAALRDALARNEYAEQIASDIRLLVIDARLQNPPTSFSSDVLKCARVTHLFLSRIDDDLAKNLYQGPGVRMDLRFLTSCLEGVTAAEKLRDWHSRLQVESFENVARIMGDLPPILNTQATSLDGSEKIRHEDFGGPLG